MSDSDLQILSQVLGWIYFFAWSISFWPQAILNFRRKKVTGLSFEFIAYNLTGFTFYTTYSLVKYFSPNGCDPNDVQINDLAFGFHAVLLTIITTVQCFLYRIERQKVHWVHAFIVAMLCVITAYTAIIAGSTDTIPLLPKCEKQSDGTYKQLTSFTLIDFMGYEKAFITFVKYLPQLYLNWKRQSTVGWSITNILLDFTGGSFSFAQQGLDSYLAGSFGPIFGNIVKFLLAAFSIIFDILFMIQHYVLYRNNRHSDPDDADANNGEDDGNDLAKPVIEDDPFDVQVEGLSSSTHGGRVSVNGDRPSSRKSMLKSDRGDNAEQYLYFEDPHLHQVSRFNQREVLSPGGSSDDWQPGMEPAFTSGHRTTIPRQSSGPYSTRTGYDLYNPNRGYAQ